tara:strand:- start:42 stop:407 length:366 start_codon:yes stop_codon:yes gene_type:complete
MIPGVIISEEKPELYFVNIANGDNVSNPIKVNFGLKNFGVVPAGINLEFAGHHHLLIDVDLEDFKAPIPSDSNHLHFGKGQTETVLSLSKGQHTLQLVLGNYLHIPHEPPIVSDKILINVN